MTTPTVTSVRDDLATVITAGCSLRAMAYLSESIPHPCAQVMLGAFDPRMVLGKSKAAYAYEVTVFTGIAHSRGAQVRCDQLREPTGATSLVAAIEDSSAWTVSVDYAAVTRIGRPRIEVIAEEALMVFTVDVEVIF